MAHILHFVIAAVLTDLMMPKIDGMDILSAVKRQTPNTDVIIMTAYATVDNAVAALQKGAVDYLQKPINLEELDIRLKKIALMKSLSHSNDELQTAMEVTERSATETIRNLEDMVIKLQSLCTETIHVLFNEATPAHERIPQAVEILKKAN